MAAQRWPDPPRPVPSTRRRTPPGPPPVPSPSRLSSSTPCRLVPPVVWCSVGARRPGRAHRGSGGLRRVLRRRRLAWPGHHPVEPRGQRPWPGDRPVPRRRHRDDGGSNRFRWVRYRQRYFFNDPHGFVGRTVALAPTAVPVPFSTAGTHHRATNRCCLRPASSEFARIRAGRLRGSQAGRRADDLAPGRRNRRAPHRRVAAAVINLTATDATGAGYVTAFPSGIGPPNASNLNLERAGQTIPNLVIVPVGADGRISIFTQAGRT